jgi:hypothetical protein
VCSLQSLVWAAGACVGSKWRHEGWPVCERRWAHVSACASVGGSVCVSVRSQRVGGRTCTQHHAPRVLTVTRATRAGTPASRSHARHVQAPQHLAHTRDTCRHPNIVRTIGVYQVRGGRGCRGREKCRVGEKRSEKCVGEGGEGGGRQCDWRGWERGERGGKEKDEGAGDVSGPAVAAHPIGEGGRRRPLRHARREGMLSRTLYCIYQGIDPILIYNLCIYWYMSTYQGIDPIGTL